MLTNLTRLLAAISALATLGLACLACQPPPTVAPTAPPPPPLAEVQRGAEVWALLACQSCHGALAEGAAAPRLRGATLDLAAFSAVVRNGLDGMRGYSPAEIDDQRLAALHAWLQTLPAAAPTPIPNDLGLSVPPDMRVAIFSDARQQPAGLTVGPDGALYVAEQGADGGGQVVRLVDQDGDGRAELVDLAATGLPTPRGLAWWTAPDRAPVLLVAGADGLAAAQAGAVRQAGALHAGRANGVAVGPDGMVYLTQGAGDEDEPLPGAVWRFDPAALLADGGPAQGERFVHGLRNAAGIAFSPSGAIYVTDNGQGWPFRPDAPDELNVLLGGADYGWPQVWGQPPAGSGSIGPMALFPAGSDADGLLFYSGRMFDEYIADLLVALPGRGQIVRVEIVSDATGYQAYIHDFIGGLQRPVALAEGAQGELYVADAASGAVYRFWR